jgi:predicted Co/Zn/Cd cation transporter (cation efflux family)
MMTGFVGLLIFCADIYAIMTILKSGLDGGAKIMWCLLVALLPVLGLAIWFIAGPKEKL